MSAILLNATYDELLYCEENESTFDAHCSTIGDPLLPAAELLAIVYFFTLFSASGFNLKSCEFTEKLHNPIFNRF